MDQSGNVRGVIWQKGVITDLNTLIPPDSPFVMFGSGINSGGQITAEALLASGQVHAILVVPEEGEDALESAMPTAARQEVQRPTVTLPENVRKLLERRMPFGRLTGALVRPQ